MILNTPSEITQEQIKQNKKTFREDRERVLAIYAGIFPRHINEFAERIAKKNKPKRNYAK